MLELLKLLQSGRLTIFLALCLGSYSCKEGERGHSGEQVQTEQVEKIESADTEVIDFHLHLDAATSPQLATMIAEITDDASEKEIIVVFSSEVSKSFDDEENEFDAQESADESLSLFRWSRKKSTIPKKVNVKDVPGNLADIPASQVNGVKKSAIVEEGATVYRGMNIDNDTLIEIMARGMDAPVVFNKGKLDPSSPVATTIKTHQRGDSSGDTSRNSIFVSTSASRQVALRFVEEGAIFKIKVPENKGIEVNKAKGSSSKYKSEKEVAIVGKVEPESIMGYYRVEKGPPKKPGPYVCWKECAK